MSIFHPVEAAEVLRSHNSTPSIVLLCDRTQFKTFLEQLRTPLFSHNRHHLMPLITMNGVDWGDESEDDYLSTVDW